MHIDPVDDLLPAFHPWDPPPLPLDDGCPRPPSPPPPPPDLQVFHPAHTLPFSSVPFSIPDPTNRGHHSTHPDDDDDPAAPIPPFVPDPTCAPHLHPSDPHDPHDTHHPHDPHETHHPHDPHDQHDPQLAHFSHDPSLSLTSAPHPPPIPSVPSAPHAPPTPLDFDFLPGPGPHTAPPLPTPSATNSTLPSSPPLTPPPPTATPPRFRKAVVAASPPPTSSSSSPTTSATHLVTGAATGPPPTTPPATGRLAKPRDKHAKLRKRLKYCTQDQLVDHLLVLVRDGAVQEKRIFQLAPRPHIAHLVSRIQSLHSDVAAALGAPPTLGPGAQQTTQQIEQAAVRRARKPLAAFRTAALSTAKELADASLHLDAIRFAATAATMTRDLPLACGLEVALAKPVDGIVQRLETLALRSANALGRTPRDAAATAAVEMCGNGGREEAARECQSSLPSVAAALLAANVGAVGTSNGAGGGAVGGKPSSPVPMPVTAPSNALMFGDGELGMNEELGSIGHDLDTPLHEVAKRDASVM